MRFRKSRGARLRADPAGQGWVLVYPERGLFLNETAAFILRLCDGTRSVTSLLGELGAQHAAPAQRIQRDVVDFLCELRLRGLIRFRGALEGSS